MPESFLGILSVQVEGARSRPRRSAGAYVGNWHKVPAKESSSDPSVPRSR